MNVDANIWSRKPSLTLADMRAALSDLAPWIACRFISPMMNLILLI